MGDHRRRARRSCSITRRRSSLSGPGFARGHVVDFLAYGNWFIGNIADIVIFAAAIAAHS
ncbi:protein of unknown function [Microbacterium sp. Nx66]|nr:protein of unknown function [Microbacterium sp. Nx66]